MIGPELQHAAGTPVKKVGVITGVSGAGKTHLRQRAEELRGLPVVDISDVYRELPMVDYVRATLEVARRTRELLRSHAHVIIEGYFLPGSPSRLLLEDELGRMDVTVSISLVHAPMETCETRLRLQRTRGEVTEDDFQVRLGMLKRCWHRAEAAARRIR